MKRVKRILRNEEGAATAEYAIATMATVGGMKQLSKTHLQR
jgi:Flp pilus assembly pilin Flp